jgi:outer membrane receptor protein involved in Fe transport
MTTINGSVPMAARETAKILGRIALTALCCAAGATSAADRTSGQLEDIVVTATRHEESLSKVPISVTALSADALDAKGIKDFQDVVRFTPGVSFDTSGSNAISIRGISSSGGAGTTGIYIDDTPIQMRAVGFNPDDTLPKTFDLDRIEVLRGPQGTLFGSGSEGGTVRYIMNQPSVSRESTLARAEMSFTRGGEANFEAGLAHGGPLIDGVLGYRASVWYRYDGGWIDRVNPDDGSIVDKHANHANTMVGRLAFLWQPSENVSVTPSVIYQNSRKHDQSTFWPAYSNVDGGVFHNGSPERIPTPDEYYLPALKIDASIGKTKFISNSSFYHRKELTGYQGTVYDLSYYQAQMWANGCGDGGETPCSWYPLIDGNGIHMPDGFKGYSTPNQITNQQDGFTQEIRWQSDDPSSRLVWTLGAFYSTSKERSIEELRDPHIIDLWTSLFGVDPSDFFGGTFYNCNGQGDPAYTSLPQCDIYYNNNLVHDSQIAAFGEATYAFNDQWKLTVGGRIAHMKFSLDHVGDGFENYGYETASASQAETAFTPKVSVAYQATPEDLYYATYSKGFRAGGGNAPLPGFCDQDLAAAGYANGAPLTYKSDSTQSYEVGSKNSFGRHLRIATSAYYIKWNDIQQSLYIAGGCGLQFTDNLGTAVAKGFDVQAEVALGSFSVDAAFGYTSARYTDDTPCGPDPANCRPLLVGKGDAISGEGAANGSPSVNPPWTASLGAQYNFSLAEHEAYVRMDYQYAATNKWPSPMQDSRVVAQYNPYIYPIGSTKFASLRAGVTIGNLQVAAFIDNLFDSRTVTNYQQGQLDANIPTDPVTGDYLYPQPTPQQNSYTYRPRTIGLTFTYKR